MNKLMMVAALMLMSANAFAQEDIRLDLKAGAQITTHASLDAVADSNTLGSRTIRVSTGLIPDLRLLIDYGLDGNGLQIRHNGGVDPTWTRHRFAAGVEYGPSLFGFLRPVAGVTVGYALGKLTLETADALYRDYSHDVVGDGYLGLEAFVKLGGRDSKWRGIAGLRFGARGQTGATFDELKGLDRDEDDPWTRVNPKLGTLHPNGWYWDIGIGVSRTF